VFSLPTKASDTSFSGFAFGSLGKATETPEKSRVEVSATEVKPSPFSGFSFQGSAEKKQETGMLFSLLAQQNASPGFTISPNTVNISFPLYHFPQYYICAKLLINTLIFYS
jgi:hypothetical protein